LSTVENPQSKFAALRTKLPSLRDASAWGVSFVLHTFLFLLLASITLYIPFRHRIEITTEPLELDDRPLPKEFHYSPEPQDEIGALGTGGIDMSRPAAPIEGNESIVPLGIEARATPGDVITNVGTSIDVREFNKIAAQAPTIPDNIIVKGVGTAGTSAAAGAVDRITHEILLSLDERPTLVA
jgi:hypothetical protein